jgi:serine phosphatase RsbU (regulator of sigma subunit)
MNRRFTHFVKIAVPIAASIFVVSLLLHINIIIGAIEALIAFTLCIALDWIEPYSDTRGIRTTRTNLRDNKAILQELIRDLPIALIVGDHHGSIACTQAFADIFQCESVQNALARHPTIFAEMNAVWDDGQPFSSDDYPLASALKGEAISREMVITPQAGAEHRRLLVTSAPLKGDFYGYCSSPPAGAVIVEDITDRRKAENSLAAQYKREHQIAETLQQSILLVEDSVRQSGFDFDACYQPAMDEAAIGGDFYDAFELTRNLVAFLIGDVSGKGLEAAAKTAESKFVLRALLREYPSPSLALIRMNDYLCEKQWRSGADFETFTCLTVVVANSKTGQVHIATAGSDSPLVLRLNEPSEPLELMESLPLGVIPSQQYKQKSIRLAEGDILLLATDGVTEARSSSELFGLDGLRQALDSLARLSSLEQISKGIAQRASDFANGRLHDDVCIVAIRRTAPSAKYIGL